MPGLLQADMLGFDPRRTKPGLVDFTEFPLQVSRSARSPMLGRLNDSIDPDELEALDGVEMRERLLELFPLNFPIIASVVLPKKRGLDAPFKIVVFCPGLKDPSKVPSCLPE